jgi:hypothetical protein
MLNTARWSSRCSAVCVVAAACYTAPLSSAFAEVPCLAASENPSSENRQEPLKIKLSGFINTKPDESSLGLVRLSITSYHMTSYFEVIVAEAIDCPRVTHRMILQKTNQYEIDFHLFGPKTLLLKVATAEPGTPLTLLGYLEPRSRNLRLVEVEVIGTDTH